MSGDVVFTYTSGGQVIRQQLLWADRISSREGLGLWHVGARAWKVFSTTSQFNALSADYRRAAVDAGLPMGNPSFQQGRVQRGTGNPSQGFVLVTEWMEGTRFLHTASAFSAALRGSNFPRGRNTQDYQRMQSGASGASFLGLRDPQGYLQPGIFEPLRFFDVHTSWNATTGRYGTSLVADEILQIANDWGQ